MEELSEQGVKLLNFMDMLPEDKLFLEKYFEKRFCRRYPAGGLEKNSHFRS